MPLNRSLEIKSLLTALILLLFSAIAFATHNRAGEITYRHISGNRFEFTITTYTEIGPDNADRPELGIYWGDNTGIDSIKRVSKSTFKASNIQKNVYIAEHSYPGAATYTVRMEDPNRNKGIQNIFNSVNIPFYIETKIKISSFFGNNNSVQLLNPPIDFACQGSAFIYNPSAWDPDGDSLVFSLTVSKGKGGQDIPGYFYPPADNELSIDPKTGFFIWDFPKTIGEFNIAILVEEYRNGSFMGSVLRDMQITVTEPCRHLPPEIKPVDDICVEAGQQLSFPIIAADTLDRDSIRDGDSVIIWVTGGPFEVQNPATFNIIKEGDPAVGLFNWDTECVNVQEGPYQVIIRASDNGAPNLTSYEAFNILVVAPPVENLSGNATSNKVELNWDQTVCNNAAGYDIYRKLGSTNYEIDSCVTGMPEELGYELIHTIKDITISNYDDMNDGFGLIPGEVYCYRIVTYFDDGAESYVSDEICFRLKKDVPIITHVSVTETDVDNGEMYVAWSKPTEYDTTRFKGPFNYVVLRSEDGVDFIAVATMPSIDDTIFNDDGLNTELIRYFYKIEMYDVGLGNEFMGFSFPAHSIFVNSIPNDNRAELSWIDEVPWRNYLYEVYRWSDAQNDFVLIGTTKEPAYIDYGLTNGREYCYRVKSIGEYSLTSIPRPLENFSQIKCEIPEDRTPPCPPEITIESKSCEQIVAELRADRGDHIEPCGSDVSVDEVTIRWTNPNNFCDSTDDVIGYKLYYAETNDGSFRLLEEKKSNFSANDTFFVHANPNTVAGCYYVIAIDSAQNASDPSDTVCEDNCFIYELPNVFTPNGDGINDLFIPFPYCYVESIDMTIVSRWGQRVFETTDPNVEWDGNDQFANDIAPTGVYYYTCTVNHITLEGVEPVLLKGFVHLIRADTKKSLE